MSTASDALARNQKVTDLLDEQRAIIISSGEDQEWIETKEADARRIVEELDAKKKEITAKTDRIKAIDEELAQLLVGTNPPEPAKKARGRPKKKSEGEAEPEPTPLPPAQKRRAAVEDGAGHKSGVLGLDLLLKVIGPQMPVGLKSSEILATANTLGLMADRANPSVDIMDLMERAVNEGWVVKEQETKRYTLTEAVLEQQEVA